MDQGPTHKYRYTESNGRESGEEPETHSHRENFLNRTSMACALRSPTDKWGLIKLKSFCKTKDIVIRTKQKPTYLKKVFTKPT